MRICVSPILLIAMALCAACSRTGTEYLPVEPRAHVEPPVAEPEPSSLSEPATPLLAAENQVAGEQDESPTEAPSAALVETTETTDTSEPAAATHTLPVGERLEYRVTFAHLTAGTSVMQVVGEEEYAGRPVARLRMETRSRGLGALFASVEDVTNSLLDAAGGGSLWFEAVRREGRRLKTEAFTVDPETGVLESLTASGEGDDRKEERQSSELAEPVQDVLSFFYALRRMDFQLGGRNRTVAFQGHKAYPFDLTTNGLERLGVRGLGTFWAYRIQPSAAVPGLFREEGSATLWVEQRTGILLRMDLSVKRGVVRMFLVSAEGSPLNEPVPER